jgi:YrbI family 3-deoxy-D-manno-octulosonate 8-phosphate phosphatase
MTEALAIIPARGGSAGVPRKNVLPLAGKPLIAYTIEQALRADRVQRVVVSTDDAEIAGVAERFGAEVVRRPAELSGPMASSESALLHVLDHLDQSEQYRPDLLVFLQCTSPLTVAADIDGAIEALEAEGADTALAVTPFHYFLWGVDADGQVVGVNHDKAARVMRQQREPQYLETGAVYVMRTDGFRAARHRFFGKTAMYVMPPERRLEIDEPVDFQVAEMLLHQRRRQGHLALLPQRPAALVMDFDGVFTDNRVTVTEDGAESVTCSRGDGMGLSALRDTGLPILVLSTENNPVGAIRCRKLGLPCLHGIDRKLPVLTDWLAENDVDPADAIYVGNDVNDLECLQAVGCPVVVADAHPDVRPAARIVLTARGGDGAVREVCDLVLDRLNP